MRNRQVRPNSAASAPPQPQSSVGRSRRASHKPGASTSAEVGRLAASAHILASWSSPDRSSTPVDETGAPVDLSLIQPQAEERLGDLLPVAAADSTPAHGFSDRCRIADQAVGDDSRDVLGVAGHGRRHRIELGPYLFDARRFRLAGKADGSPRICAKAAMSVGSACCSSWLSASASGGRAGRAR